MPPEIAKTMLLDEWVIVTRWHTNRDGVKIANTKYPIPEKTIERMAYEFLLKGMENYEKGYSFELTDCITKQVFKVTVEHVHGTPRQSNDAKINPRA